jgi:hypothetical protein
MGWNKLKLFIIKHKINYLAYIVFIVCALGVIFSLFIFPSGYLYQKENVAVWGTLFGALVGGIFTLLGTQIVSQREIKRRLYAKQKDEVLSPLYNELKENHDDILVGNPYPSVVGFQKGPQTTIPYPQYSVWGAVKNDVRYFETPKKLAIQMDQLYDVIKEYSIYRQIVADVVEEKIKEIVAVKLGITCCMVGIGDFFLPYILSGQVEEFRSVADEYIYLNKKQLAVADEKQKTKAYNEILEKCNELSEAVKLKNICIMDKARGENLGNSSYFNRINKL